MEEEDLLPSRKPTQCQKKKELQQHDDPRHFNRPISGRHLELHAKKIRETNLLSSIHYMQ